MAELTKEQLIKQANIMRESAEKMADWEGQPGERARAALGVIEIALAALTAEPFMYGIADPDGVAHFDEECVGSDAGILQDEVDCLNDEACGGDGPRGVESDEYRVVALYRLPEVK